MQDDFALAAQAVESVPETADEGCKRSRREIALKFWFGPVRLWTVAFNMEVEQWRPDPFDVAVRAAPKLAELPDDVAGVYRPSQRVGVDEPDLQVSSMAVRYIESRFHRRFIDLTIGFDAYMSKFAGKTRSTFRRKVRKFQEASAGEIDWRAYRSAQEMEDFYAKARQISKRTYQEKLFDAGLPEDPDFVAGMLARADAGLVRGFVLFLGGAPISYLYLPIAEGRVIYGRLGFDPTYAALSPGTILQLLALESLFAERRHQIFDFTEGEGEHKRLFATHESLCGNVYYLRPTARSRAIVRLHLATRRLSNLADRQLARGNLKTRLKHHLRGQHRGLREAASVDRGDGAAPKH